jgi:hypothetical protein
MAREALADDDADRVIDLQAVLAWNDSLDSANPLSVPVDGVEVDRQSTF